MKPDKTTLDWYARNNLKPPETIDHNLTPDDIGERVQRAVIKSWRQEGNHLIADTDIGEVVNVLPTNLILTGTDKNNLPTFKKL